MKVEQLLTVETRNSLQTSTESETKIKNENCYNEETYPTIKTNNQEQLQRKQNES
jgi:hypothetical protein